MGVDTQTSEEPTTGCPAGLNWFRWRREALELTQRRIADGIVPPMTSAAVGAWEREEACPPLAIADQLAELYRVDFPEMVLQIALQARRMAEARKAVRQAV